MILSVVPAMLGVLGLAVLARETPAAAQDRPPPLFQLAPFGRRFRVFLMIMVVFTLGNSSDAFLVLRAQQAGLSVLGVLGMVLSYNLVYSILSGPAGALSDRIGSAGCYWPGGWFTRSFTWASPGSPPAGRLGP